MLITMLELLGLLFAAAGLWVAGTSYSRLPERVPIHFDFRGKPDSWAGKPAIWLMPVLGALSSGTLLALSLGFTPPPARLLFALLGAEIPGLFLWILWGQVLIARGDRARLGAEIWAMLALVMLTAFVVR